MANDCDFKVLITGEVENLDKLNQVLNCEEIKSDGMLRTDSYHILFSDTSNENWGSKWTVFNDIEYSDDLLITGYSAWGPTTGLWRKISQEYEVNLTLEYSEKGMDFAGVIKFENGDELSHEEMTYWEYIYDYDPEYMWQQIEDQCTWDELDGVKETLSSVWSKFDSSDIKRIEDYFSKV